MSCEGEPIRLTSLQFTGLDSLPTGLRQRVLYNLPIQQGDVLNWPAVQATAKSIIYRLRDHGYSGADVNLQFDPDSTAHAAAIRLGIVPGIWARISSVAVEGTHRIDSALVRRLLVAQPGHQFSEGELMESQRSLYRSDLFRPASVGIDSALYRPGSDSVPLLVQVNESPPHRIRAGLGFATNDCFRSSLGWTSRNFWGGGNILDLSGRVSKVGVGTPLDWGLANGLCGALADDTIGSTTLNFGLSSTIGRPSFLSPYNNIAVSLYAERRSEFKVYLRRETGMSFTFTREVARRQLPLSLTYTLSYGHTEATAANFFAYFNACTPDVLQALQQNRVLATLTASATRPRIDNPIDPTCCSLATVEITHSSKYIGSSVFQQFTRITADAAWCRPLAREVVLSWRIRGGFIFAPRLDLAMQSGAFVPPDDRFYAGGPNDVRGFERNELGPVVYVVPESSVDTATGAIDPGAVRVAATGGNTLGVANVELRFPSPVFSSRVRLAAFVDAGTLGQRQAASLPQFIRVTPGLGIRVATPLGPARLDVAYNPYALQRGTLFQFDTTGALTPVPGQDSYILDRNR